MSKRNLHMKVHSSIIHNSPKADTIQIFINSTVIVWNKQDVVYPNNGILLSNKRNEVLIQATTWINLESISLDERNQ